MSFTVHGFGTVKNVEARTFGKDNDRTSYRGDIEAFDGTTLNFDAKSFDPSGSEGKIVFFSGRYEKIDYVKKDTGEAKTFNALRLQSLRDPETMHESDAKPQEAVVVGGYTPDDDDIPF